MRKSTIALIGVILLPLSACTQTHHPTPTPSSGPKDIVPAYVAVINQGNAALTKALNACQSENYYNCDPSVVSPLQKASQKYLDGLSGVQIPKNFQQYDKDMRTTLGALLMASDLYNKAHQTNSTSSGLNEETNSALTNEQYAEAVKLLNKSISELPADSTPEFQQPDTTQNKVLYITASQKDDQTLSAQAFTTQNACFADSFASGCISANAQLQVLAQQFQDDLTKLEVPKSYASQDSRIREGAAKINAAMFLAARSSNEKNLLGSKEADKSVRDALVLEKAALTTLNHA
jgi:hypothetical protein